MKIETVITNMLAAGLGSCVFSFTFFYTANGIFLLLFKKPFFHVTRELSVGTCIVFIVAYLFCTKWEQLMKFIKKNNIYKAIMYMCIAYVLSISFLAFQVYRQGESFNWIGYGLLFCFVLIAYFVSLPCVNYYLKKTTRMQQYSYPAKILLQVQILAILQRYWSNRKLSHRLGLLIPPEQLKQ